MLLTAGLSFLTPCICPRPQACLTFVFSVLWFKYFICTMKAAMTKPDEDKFPEDKPVWYNMQEYIGMWVSCVGGWLWVGM